MERTEGTERRKKNIMVRITGRIDADLMKAREIKGEYRSERTRYIVKVILECAKNNDLAPLHAACSAARATDRAVRRATKETHKAEWYKACITLTEEMIREIEELIGEDMRISDFLRGSMIYATEEHRSRKKRTRRVSC